MVVATLTAALLLLTSVPLEPGQSSNAVDVKVTQKYLMPVCLDERRVAPGERDWRLSPGSHSLAFTMRNASRRGVEGAAVAPGIAVVRFILDPEHTYEVEIRAPAATFASRVWKRGDWKPVVRDRTANRIVSGEPEWLAAGCER
jgi:hypothetical protein